MPSFMNEFEKAKWRRELVHDNPHLVDAYFTERVKEFIKTFFGNSGMEYKWFWFRVEYQSCGTAHVHGCLRLKNDPGMDQLVQDVLKGRITEHQLKLMNYIPDKEPNTEQMDDEFLDLHEL